MIINSKYIYILFTTFTTTLINILFACKYCKYGRNTANILINWANNIKTGKIHIYIDLFIKSLIYRSKQFLIYSIYNIYKLEHIPMPQLKIIL